MTEVRLATAERPILLVVDLPCPRPLQLHAGHNWEAEQWQWDAQGFKAEPAGEPVASSTSGSGRASKEADTTTGSGHQSGSVDAGRAKVCAISWLYSILAGTKVHATFLLFRDHHVCCHLQHLVSWHRCKRQSYQVLSDGPMRQHN